MLASMAEREQTRTLSRAKIHRMPDMTKRFHFYLFFEKKYFLCLIFDRFFVIYV